MIKSFRKTWMIPVLSLLVTASAIAVIVGIQQGIFAKYSADYPAYETLEAAVTEADAIVFGKIIEAQKKKIDVGVVSDYNVFRVKINEVISGKVEVGEVIEIKTLAMEDTTLRSMQLKDANDYIFFIKLYEDVPASLINPYQGALLVEEKGAITADPLNTIFSGATAQSYFGKKGSELQKTDVVRAIKELK